jgi:hypothetical protein
MTRNGKIARLPAAVREQLNQRLLDGRQGKLVVQWLNSLPEVQAVMKETFQERPITEKNLSEWKTGGYVAWLEGQRLGNAIESLMENTAALPAAAKEGLTDQMALMLAATMADQMLRLRSMPEGIEKARIWRELRIGLVALRRSELCAEKLRIELIKHPPPKQAPTLSIAERRKQVMDFIGIDEGFDGSINPELTRSPYETFDPPNPTESK